MASNPDASALSRPLIRILMDERGNPVLDASLVDLTVRDASGQFVRTIIRTEDPHRYGISIGDYFA